MKSKISETMLRNRLGAALDRVSRGDELTIHRRGRPLAVLISALKFDVMRRVARRHAFAALKRHGGSLTDAQAMELGLEAQRWARKKRRPTVRRRAK